MDRVYETNVNVTAKEEKGEAEEEGAGGWSTDMAKSFAGATRDARACLRE